MLRHLTPVITDVDEARIVRLKDILCQPKDSMPRIEAFEEVVPVLEPFIAQTLGPLCSLLGR